MTDWTNEELNAIGNAEEVELVALRTDGTLGKPVTIWVVRSGNNLYVRAYKGRTSPWFRAASTYGEGQIRAGGVEKDVSFEAERDPAVNDALDGTYRTKYREQDAQYVEPMVTAAARDATLKLVPRATG